MLSGIPAGSTSVVVLHRQRVALQHGPHPDHLKTHNLAIDQMREQNSTIHSGYDCGSFHLVLLTSPWQQRCEQPGVGHWPARWVGAELDELRCQLHLPQNSMSAHQLMHTNTGLVG